MTAYQEMLRQAYAEFDRQVEEREIETRLQIAAQGRSAEEIEIYVAACRDNVARQRVDVGRLVAAEFQRAGIPLDYSASDEVTP